MVVNGEICKLAWLNGQIVPLTDLRFTYQFFTPSLLVIREPMRVWGVDILFFDAHLLRLREIANTYGIYVGAIAEPQGEVLADEIKRLVVRNKAYTGGIVELCFASDRKNSTETVDCWMTLIKNIDPLTAISPQIDFIAPIHRVVRQSGFATSHPSIEREYFALALCELQQKAFQNGIFVNEKGFVCDTTKGNIFVVENEKVFTPALTSGCCNNILRSIVIKALSNLNIEVVEVEEMSMENIETATELFIAGIEFGITGVKGFNDRRYYDRVRQMVIRKMGESV